MALLHSQYRAPILVSCQAAALLGASAVLRYTGHNFIAGWRDAQEQTGWLARVNPNLIQTGCKTEPNRRHLI